MKVEEKHLKNSGCNIKKISLLSKFLNEKKSRIRCNFGNLPTSWLQTLRQLLGSFYLIFSLKFTFVTQLLFYSMCREKMKKGEVKWKI